MKNKELFPLYSMFLITAFLCVVVSLLTFNLPAFFGWGTSLFWFCRSTHDEFEDYINYVKSAWEGVKSWLNS